MDGHNIRVLSIDAWGNSEDGYDWNAWYKVGEIDKETFESLKTDSDYLQWYIDNGYINNIPSLVCINDDGYNIVLIDAKTSEPLFAIEYGNCY